MPGGTSIPQGLWVPPRVATLYVAASDALDRSRAQADFLCTGVNDHLQIQAALDALPAAGGELALSEGTFHIEASINVDSYQTLRGCGRSTILTTTTANLIFLSAIGGSGTELTNIMIADLQIDGGAGAISDCGIYFEYVDYSLIENVYSRRHASGTGSYLMGIFLKTSDFNTLVHNICQGNGNGIYVYLSVNNTVSDNICQGNDAGIYISSSVNNTVSDNMCQGNGEGLFLDSDSNNNIISGNVCQANTFNGLSLNGASTNIVSGNTCQGNKRCGIYLSSSNFNTIIGNNLTENSQDATNIYDDILLVSSDYNNIQGNTCRAGALANKPRYGINISNAASDGNLVTNNDLYNDGFGTGSLNDAGTGTVTVAGNRV